MVLGKVVVPFGNFSYSGTAVMKASRQKVQRNWELNNHLIIPLSGFQTLTGILRN